MSALAVVVGGVVVAAVVDRGYFTTSAAVVDRGYNFTTSAAVVDRGYILRAVSVKSAGAPACDAPCLKRGGQSLTLVGGR